MKKKSIYAMILSSVVAASMMGVVASAASKCLPDTKVKKKKFSLVTAWYPNLDNVTGCTIEGVCLYDGVTKAKTKVWDDTEQQYRLFNNDETVSGAYRSGEQVYFADCGGKTGYHWFYFYTEGWDGSGHVSARAETY
ncbi:MAG: hypothetical protein VZR73_05155 [Acutalibacteraceae bacterium]|jgi:hypothetical protein|nr:hypothetical protein [Acutalibacteraceae bacterium]